MPRGFRRHGRGPRRGAGQTTAPIATLSHQPSVLAYTPTIFGGRMKRRRAVLSAVFALCLASMLVSAQTPDNKVFYFPKPTARTPWTPPMKPVTHLADVKARHKGETSWREPVIHDENTRAFLVQEPTGTTGSRRLYPDSPAWWAVLDGRVRFDVEKPDRTFETFEATKSTYVFVPERMLHSY